MGVKKIKVVLKWLNLGQTAFSANSFGFLPISSIFGMDFYIGVLKKTIFCFCKKINLKKF